ncbi:ABC transporter ATP-binding protein [Candidatus Binatia bacterium]|nr:ABC transporter ATP-binding protein [Candidatus Binatia bacterium]
MTAAHGPGEKRPILCARNLGKHYSLSRSRLRRLWRGPNAASRAAPHDEGLWAVRDVSLALDRGDAIGVIGANGGGKSTLLRLLAGTARPSEGTIEWGASVASLLDLGVGFHPLETGRENAETALILQAGMSRREARQRVAEVAAFADLRDFFDRPIRIYSDGMRLRLGFAVITLLSADVLVTDEILAVGDQGFQRRCEAWLDRFMGNGGTLILCSHDLSQVQRLCSHALWMSGGRARASGDPRAVIRAYRQSLGGSDDDALDQPLPGRAHAIGEVTNLPFEVVALALQDETGRDVTSVSEGATVLVTVDVHAPAAVPQVFIGITRADLTPIYGLASDMDGAVPQRIDGDRYRFRLRFSDLPLVPERYRLRAHAMDETGTRLYDTVELTFDVTGRPCDGGLVRPHVRRSSSIDAISPPS